MRLLHYCFSFLFLIGLSVAGYGQDSAAFHWKVSSVKIGEKKYELHFSTAIDNNWELYSPGQEAGGVATTEIFSLIPT